MYLFMELRYNYPPIQMIELISVKMIRSLFLLQKPFDLVFLDEAAAVTVP